MDRDDKIFTAVVATLIIGAFVLMFFAANKMHKMEIACENSGGQAITTKNNVYCVDKRR